MTITSIDDVWVTGGVDTHRDTDMVAALDQRGAQLGVREFTTTPAGHRAALLARVVRGHRPGRCRGHRHLWRRAHPVPAPPRRDGDRGRLRRPSSTTQPRQVRSRRRRRSSAGRPVRQSNDRPKIRDRQRGRDTRPANGPQVSDSGSHQCDQSDARPDRDRTRRSPRIYADPAGHPFCLVSVPE